MRDCKTGGDMGRTGIRKPQTWMAFLRLSAGKLRTMIIQMVYPEGAICLGCGRISDGEPLCSACRAELENGDILGSWVREDVDGVSAWSIRPHRGLARTLVLRLKHGAERRATDTLTGLLRSRPDYFPAFSPETVVTWVPMPKERRRERAIDHGQLLAEGVAAELGLSCRSLLLRHGNDRPQARLNMIGRQKNLRNAFAPAEKICFPVLLVDDVLTTGTTAKRCVEALRMAGGVNITILTMTRAARL